jgi:microcystin-dependent protein
VCDGRPISRTTYAALFSVIGTAFGAGDLSTTFNLPDMRGRSPIGAGQGSGLANRVLATTGGEENHTLSTAEMPSHTHPTAATGVSVNAAATGVGVNGNPSNVSISKGGGLVPSWNHNLGVFAAAAPASGGQSIVGYGGAGLAATANDIGISDPWHTHTTSDPTHGHSIADPKHTHPASGGDVTHNNMPPFAVLNYVIRYQ